MKARLIVADDHQIVREGLRKLVEPSPDLEVVAEAANGLEAERLAREGRAELLLLDVALPGRRGVQVLQSLRASGVGLPVLFFSMYPPEQYAGVVRRAGAQGYVPKSADAGEVLRAARRVIAGGMAFPERAAAPRPKRGPRDPFATLSRREAEVLQGLIAGTRLDRIAKDLGIDAKSVSTYRRRLLDKLDAKSNAELIALAIRHGYA